MHLYLFPLKGTVVQSILLVILAAVLLLEGPIVLFPPLRVSVHMCVSVCKVFLMSHAKQVNLLH